MYQDTYSWNSLINSKTSGASQRNKTGGFGGSDKLKQTKSARQYKRSHNLNKCRGY